jgi:hypothetical protein
VLGGGGKEGKREAERDVTARMLFRVVRGSWGRAAERAEGSQVSFDGTKGWGCQNVVPAISGVVVIA